MLFTLKKSFYYNFIPSKAEEEACKAANTPYKTTRVLIEIRDVYPPPVSDPHSPWQIKKVLTPGEAGTGRMVLSFHDAFEHVFRYWTMEMANRVELGNRQNVVVWDVTDETNPTSYAKEDVFLDKVVQLGLDDGDYYALWCMELIRDRRVNAGDEIGLFWEVKSDAFQLKIIRRAE